MTKACARYLSLTIFLTALCLTATAQQTLGVFTQMYENTRTGNNPYETILTPKNVNATKFGKLFSFTVDGQIYAQPLWVMGVKIPGQGTHTVVYAATEMDSVYAFDANTGVQLWAVNFTDPANGIIPVPCGTDGSGHDISCSVYPYYGITGTPAIDISSNTMYLVARTYDTTSSTGYQTLHALDITTGAEKFGGPVVIQGSVPGSGLGSINGIVTFNPLADIQRPSLLLENNNVTHKEAVYIAWAGAAHGWIMAYDAKTLQQTAIYNTTPDQGRGGVWQSGNGLAADAQGYIYASTGDGPFDADSGGRDYSDSLLKMDGNLNIVDYFTPMDQGCRAENDFDVSSSGPMVLPPEGGQFPNEVLESGKGGNPCDSTGAAPIYLVDRDNMGKYSSTNDNIVQEIAGAPIGYWSSPAYFRNGTQNAIYYAGVTSNPGNGDYLKMYTLTAGNLSSTPVSQSSNVFPIGTTPTTSGNKTTNGIVWATLRQEALSIQPGQLPAILYAYDATDVSKMLYNSAQNPSRDQGGCANKFQNPIVANGKVYVGTQNQVDVFGLIGNPPVAPYASLGSPCYTFSKQAVGTTSPPRFEVFTNIGTANMTLGTVTFRGLNASDFAQTNNCPATLAPNASCTIKITFTPGGTGPRVGQLMIGDNAIGTPHNVALVGKGI